MDNMYILNKERAVISTLIDAHINNFNLEKVFLTSIKSEMFYLPAHQKIFELIYLYFKRDKPFTIDNIMKDIDSKEVSDSIMVEIISTLSLTEKLIFSAIEDLKEAYLKRKYSEMSNQVKKMITEGNTDSDTIKQYLESSLNNLGFVDMENRAKSLTKVREERKTKPERARIKTYVPFIDSVFTKKGKTGIKRGHLGFISGLKESGKTFTLTRIIENVSRDMPVFFGSLEFGEEDYDENIEEQQNDGFFEGNTDNIFIKDDVYDINQLVAEIRYQHKVNNIQLAGVDSMLRITNNDPEFATDTRKLSDIFSKLGKLAKELDIPIIIIVQSSKEDLKSSIVSVKGCMDADHEAYWWYHMFKTSKDKPEDERRTVIWVKNKDTKKHPKQYLMFVPQTADFYQFEANEQGYPARALHKYRQPKYQVPEANYSKEPEITNYKNREAEEEKKVEVEMPEFDF